MPKKDGVIKTYSFSVKTVEMLTAICEKDKRSQTNCIEKLIEDKFAELTEKERRVDNAES